MIVLSEVQIYRATPENPRTMGLCTEAGSLIARRRGQTTSGVGGNPSPRRHPNEPLMDRIKPHTRDDLRAQVPIIQHKYMNISNTYDQ
jgi:hypothetical protein